MVDAAVAVVQLLGIGAHGQRGDLVSQADAEDGDAAVVQLAHAGDGAGAFLGVSGAVGEHHAVGVDGEHVAGGGVLREHGDVAAPAAERLDDGILRAVVHQRDLIARAREMLGLRAADHLDHAGDAVSARDLGAGLYGLALAGGDHAVHGALRAQVAGQRAGVKARDAGDVPALEVAVQLLLAAVVGGAARHGLHNKSRGPGAAAFRIFFIDAIIAHQRIGHGDALSGIGRIGEHLKVSGHRGVEHDLTDDVTIGTNALALKYRAVLQDQIRLHARSLPSLILSYKYTAVTHKKQEVFCAATQFLRSGALQTRPG